MRHLDVLLTVVYALHPDWRDGDAVGQDDSTRHGFGQIFGREAAPDGRRDCVGRLAR